MTDVRRPPRHLLREALLNLGAGLGVLCVLAAVASIGFSIRPLIFRSGSMGPEIRTGALGLARTVPAAELSVGDVVSVVNDRGVRVTHRIQTTRYIHPSAALTLRGDANPTADPDPYVVTEADRLFFSVNYVGYGVGVLSSPWGTFGGGLLAGALLMYAFGRRETPEPVADRDRGPTGPSALSALMVATVLAGSALVVRPAALDTEAAFTDSATALTGTFLAQLTPPVLTCRIADTTTVEVAWGGVPGATGYSVTVNPLLGAPVTSTVGSSTRTFQRSALVEVGTIVVRTTASTWTSAASNTVNYNLVAGLLDSCSA
jgi:signal peptidase I